MRSASRPDLRLSPVGIARAACWPLDSLDELGGAVAAADMTGTSVQAERAYAMALAADRQALWRMTVDDPRFLKALRLSSASAWRRSLDAVPRRALPRNRAMRLVEHTLYRYLARAAGRTTPHGLWAGVAGCAVGGSTRVEAQTARCAFAPDLAVFQTMVGELAQRDDYRDRSLWQLNPTLQPVAGGWQFLRRGADGGVGLATLKADPALVLVLECLARQPPSSLTELALVLAGDGVVLRSTACLPALRALASGGVLIGGLALAARFDTPWDALARTETRLLPHERTAWQRCTMALRGICDQLGESCLDSTSEDFAACLDQAAAPLAVLATQIGVTSALPDSVLRADLRLPWRVSFSRQHHAAMMAALTDYDDVWQASLSVVAAARDSRRRAYVAHCGNGLDLTAATQALAAHDVAIPVLWPAPHTLDDRDMARRLAAWERVLAGETPARVRAPDAAAGAPFGCWLVGIGDGGLIHAQGASDLPTMASARHAGLLDLSRHDRWLRRGLHLSAHERGFELAELVVPVAGQANALARPGLVTRMVSPWLAEPGALCLAGARVVGDAHGTVAVMLPGEARPSWVLSLASANLQASDPLAAALLFSAHLESAALRQRPIDVPTDCEVREPRFTPRVHLPGGACLVPRRTVLTTDLDILGRMRGFERFRHWQRLAAQHDWPPLLEVAGEQGTPLLVRRDSPLAVEAMCKGLAGRTRYLMVKEMANDSALTTPGGRRHRCDVAWPFVRRHAGTAA